MDIENQSQTTSEDHSTKNHHKQKHIPKNGNYKGYYKFRNTQEKAIDTRIQGFKQEWFTDQKALDIGCNEGEFTFLIAKTFPLKTLLGIDVDHRLIDSAKSAVKREIYDYCVHKKSIDVPKPSSSTTNPSRTFVSNAFMPRSVALSKPITNTHVPTTIPIDNNNGNFPFNIRFTYDDFMLPKSLDERGYGIILCMSVVKWIHLNSGDNGLLDFFRRLYHYTNLGGRVILEYQSWKSYLNNKSATEEIKKNFNKIQLRPDDFERILTEDIGFMIEYRLGTPLHESKEFNRPILVLLKPLPLLAQISTEIQRHALNDDNEMSMDTNEEMIVEKESSQTVSNNSFNHISTDIFGIKRKLGDQSTTAISYGISTEEQMEIEDTAIYKRPRIEL